MAKRELQPRFDGRKSFGKKAWVIDENGELVLKSYDTTVAMFKNGQPSVRGLYSATTTRHIKEFLRQGGVNVKTTADIKKLIRSF
jgi:hypothetical protein